MTLKSKRVDSLKAQGFLPFEYQALRNTAISKSYARRIRRKRKREYNKFIGNLLDRGMSRARAEREWRGYIFSVMAADKAGLLQYARDSDSPFAWGLFRAVRKEAIRQRIWDETPRYTGKAHRKVDSSGHYFKHDKAEKARQRQRRKARVRV